VDFAKGHLHVRRLKGGIHSVHPIQGDELRALRELRREQQPESAFVFTTERGGSMTRSNVAKIIESAGDRAGLPHKHPHMLRHTCGHLLADAGHDTRFRDIHILLAVPRPYVPDPVLRSPATRARIAREQIWNTPPEILSSQIESRHSAAIRLPSRHRDLAIQYHQSRNQRVGPRPLARARETTLRLIERRVFCPGRARPRAMTQRWPWIRFALAAMVGGLIEPGLTSGLAKPNAVQ
jgi:hypothetical protein